MPVTLHAHALNARSQGSQDFYSIDALSDKSTSDRINDINKAASSQIENIRKKGIEVEASIPEDYSELSSDVVSLKNSQAIIKGSGTDSAVGIATVGPGPNVASGEGSFALGRNNTASGYASAALGEITTASGGASLAANDHTKAAAFASTATGICNEARGAASIVGGLFCDPDTNDIDENRKMLVNGEQVTIGVRKYLMLMGNGESQEVRSNALALDVDGNLVIGGHLTTKDFDSKELLPLFNSYSDYEYVDLTKCENGAPSSFDIGSTVTFGSQEYWRHLVLNIGSDFELGDTFRVVQKLYNESYYYVLYLDKDNKVVSRDCQGLATATVSSNTIVVPNNESIKKIVFASYSGIDQTDSFNICKYSWKMNPDICNKESLLCYNINPIFEIGNITITNSGWSYGGSNVRIRTPEEHPIPLKKGDKISFSDYSKIRYYIGWCDDKGTYYYAGWLTRDFDVEASGDYVLLVEKTPSSIIRDMSDITDLLTIRHYTDLSSNPYISGNGSNIRTHLFDKKKCRTIAHAGIAVPGYHENTKSAFIASAKAGVWGLETDIMKTKDGHYICSHDVFVDNISTSTGLVSNYTLSELQNMTLKDRSTGVVIEDKYCDFRDYLDVCRIYGCVPVIELKVPQQYDGQTVTTQYDYEYIVNEIDKRGLSKRCVIQSFWDSYVTEVRNYNLDITIAVIMDSVQTNTSNTWKSMKNDGNGMIIIQQDLSFDRNYVDAAHDDGIHIFTWTSYESNRSQSILNISKLVDGIIADGVVDILKI